MANKDQYRISPGRKVPVQPRMQSEPPTAAGSAMFSKVADTEYARIMTTHNLNFVSSQLVLLSCRGDATSKPKDTLVIETNSEANFANWKAAANQINEIFLEEAKTEGLQYRIEIRNSEKWRSDKRSRHPMDDATRAAIHLVADVAQKQIYDGSGGARTVSIPQGMLTSGWDFMMRVPRQEPDGPGRATFMVGVTPRAKHNWDVAENEIRAAINEVLDEHGVEIEIDVDLYAATCMLLVLLETERPAVVYDSDEHDEIGTETCQGNR